MIVLRARAKGTGRRVNWEKFKQGEWVDERWWRFCTVIPDVIVDVVELCKAIDAECSMETLFPNGFFTAQFDIAIRGRGFLVTCGRRLVRGWFPLNPLAAEFGANYDVLVAVSAEDPAVETALASAVQDGYECRPEQNIAVA
jgi:hypothetical protein